jgi:DNA invertase Pin-like site-specific DNA recombinase
MKLGYARVSTDAQETHLQMDALKRAKCGRIYQEKASGAKTERPELMRLLDNARKGDVTRSSVSKHHARPGDARLSPW